MNSGPNSLTVAGDYTELFESSNGCDSTVNLSLLVANTYDIETSQTICAGESIEFDSQTITESGTYESTFQSTAGCDSLVTLTVNVAPIFQEEASAEICSNDTYEFGTQLLTTAGEYMEIFSSSEGCDSTVTLTLSINSINEENVELSLCGIESYEFGSQTLTASGTYSELFTNSTGCDSTVNLTLTLIDNYEVSTEASICEGESFDFGGRFFLMLAFIQKPLNLHKDVTA